VPIGLPQRPEPPASMPDSQKVLWRGIVAEQLPDYFFAGSLPLLAQYVRHVDTASKIERLLQATDPDANMPLYSKLGDMRARETKAICSLSTKLRLAPSNRWDGRKRLPVVAREKPWD
jgi:hypothetical protein